MARTLKFINCPESVVQDCLSGFVLSNKGVRLSRKHKIVLRSDVTDVIQKRQVCLISGGGSGHEPAQAGYVGKGMLTAAVCGDVFASPPSAAILQAINMCKSSGGLLLIVTNYTGDRLNFGIAAEQAKGIGLDVSMLIVDDDCAVLSKQSTAGRRGLCGTVFVHKIAGALAEQGKSLDHIVKYTKEVIKDIKTISISLSPCSIPGQSPTFSIPENVLEFGLGVHGEPGIKRMKLESSFDISKQMIEYILKNEESIEFKEKDVAVIINNLGSTSNFEMNIFTNDILQHLREERVNVKRCYVGRLMTSLEMAGVSVSLLLVDEKRLELLDFKTFCQSWPGLGLLNI